MTIILAVLAGCAAVGWVDWLLQPSPKRHSAWDIIPPYVLGGALVLPLVLHLT